MNKIIKIKCEDQKKSKTVLLCVFLLGAIIFMYGCSKPRTKDRSCTPDLKLSSYWAELNLPKVDGAVLCKEFTTDKLYKNVEFIHYRNEEQHFRDFYELYQEEFKRNNWLIEEVTPGQGILIIKLYKNRERFLATFKDCMDFDDDVRRCSSVTFQQSKADFIKP